MPQLQLWNPWFDGARLAFDVVVPGFDAPIRANGPWLAEAVGALGARPAGPARLRPARFSYPGDYSDSTEWEDRWRLVTLVELDVESGVTNPAHFERPYVDLWAEDEEMIDFTADRDPAHDRTALLIVDFPSSVAPPADYVRALAEYGPTTERVFRGEAAFSKLQPIRQFRTVADVSFPGSAREIEGLLQRAKSLGASTEWRLTYHPNNT
jgi:hypothetical protein